MKDVFLPPGIQARMWAKYRRVPRMLSERYAVAIDELWARRNTAPESELLAIDIEMEVVVSRAMEEGQ